MNCGDQFENFGVLDTRRKNTIFGTRATQSKTLCSYELTKVSIKMVHTHRRREAGSRKKKVRAKILSTLIWESERDATTIISQCTGSGLYFLELCESGRLLLYWVNWILMLSFKRGHQDIKSNLCEKKKKKTSVLSACKGLKISRYLFAEWELNAVKIIVYVYS